LAQAVEIYKYVLTLGHKGEAWGVRGAS
jgi:hypothetical protein